MSVYDVRSFPCFEPDIAGCHSIDGEGMNCSVAVRSAVGADVFVTNRDVSEVTFVTFWYRYVRPSRHRSAGQLYFCDDHDSLQRSHSRHGKKSWR